MLREIDDITADMASRDATVSGQTRLGVIGTTARWLMPQFLGRLGQQHPNVRIIIQDGATSTLVPNLLSGQLNAAVIHLPVDDPELVIEPLFAEDLLLLADKSHPLAKHDTIALADLDDVPLLLPPTGSALRRVLDRAAATADITLRPQAEIDGVRLLASLAIDGFGASIVPATAVPTWLQGSFRRITVPELPRRVVAFARRRRPRPSAPTMAARDTLRDVVGEQGDASTRRPSRHRRAGGPPPGLTPGTVRAMTSAELRDTWWGHQPGDLDLASLVPGAARPMMRRVRDRDVIWIDVDEPGDVVRLSSTTSAKIEYGLTAARDSGLPVVLVLSSAGADIIEGMPALDAWGRVAAALASCSGRVPTIAVVDGPAVSGPALLLGLADFTIMTESSYAFVNGPVMVEEFTGVGIDVDELGGATTHARYTGVATMVVADREAAVEAVGEPAGVPPRQHR